jgi:predicted nucleotidyltransferase
VTDDAAHAALGFAHWLAYRCAAALGGAVVSVILHGSLKLGEFTPGRSDIDMLVVVDAPLGDDQVMRLQGAVEQPRTEAPTRVDLRLVTRATAASPPRVPELEAAFEIRLGNDKELMRRVAEPDLLAELSIARANGRRIVGAAPWAVIGTVPAEWLRDVGDRQLAMWQDLIDDADHSELMVLTACRIWRFSAEGVHCSKAAAGRWALDRDPSLRAVEEALRQRTIDPAVPIGEEGIRRLLGLVRRELA